MQKSCKLYYGHNLTQCGDSNKLRRDAAMEFTEKIKKLKKIIDDSESICVFTGAGISCPSGIPDFRSADGLYNKESGIGYRPEEIISHSFFIRNTDMFYDFYKSSMLYPNAEPNCAHRYFANLEKSGKKVSVVTQNIDGLHQKAGSKNVTELHGAVDRNYCTGCGKFFTLDYIVRSNGVPHCDECGAVIKPDVVLYEEALKGSDIDRATKAVFYSDTLIVVGTSLAVYPAAGFVQQFNGKHLILINKQPTPVDEKAELVFNGDVTEVVKALEKVEAVNNFSEWLQSL